MNADLSIELLLVVPDVLKWFGIVVEASELWGLGFRVQGLV